MIRVAHPGTRLRSCMAGNRLGLDLTPCRKPDHPGSVANAAGPETNHRRRPRGRTRKNPPTSATELLPDAQLPNDIQITLRIFAANIVEQTSTSADQTQQTPPRSEIFAVGSHVFGQTVDSLRQNRDLHLRRSGIRIVMLVVSDDLLFSLFRDRHSFFWVSVVSSTGLIEATKCTGVSQTRNGNSPTITHHSSFCDSISFDGDQSVDRPLRERAGRPPVRIVAAGLQYGDLKPRSPPAPPAPPVST